MDATSLFTLIFQPFQSPIYPRPRKRLPFATITSIRPTYIQKEEPLGTTAGIFSRIRKVRKGLPRGPSPMTRKKRGEREKEEEEGGGGWPLLSDVARSRARRKSRPRARVSAGLVCAPGLAIYLHFARRIYEIELSLHEIVFPSAPHAAARIRSIAPRPRTAPSPLSRARPDWLASFLPFSRASLQPVEFAGKM